MINKQRDHILAGFIKKISSPVSILKLACIKPGTDLTDIGIADCLCVSRVAVQKKKRGSWYTQAYRQEEALNIIYFVFSPPFYQGGVPTRAFMQAVPPQHMRACVRACARTCRLQQTDYLSSSRFLFLPDET